MKVAVVGSGIAGLSTAWLLSQHHEVAIYELHPSLGMDAEAATVPCGDRDLRVDVPMRVFFPAYYPLVTKLYDYLGIESDDINYSASSSDLDGRFYFQYTNYKFGQKSIPFLSPSGFLSPSAIQIGLDFLKLNRNMNQETRDLDKITFGEYLISLGLSYDFRERFLIPAYAGICTCSNESVRNYPASIIVDYLTSGLVMSAMKRVRLGTKQVVERLSANIDHIHLLTPVASVTRDDTGVTLTTSKGDKARFDHVVFATQANHTRKILADITPQEEHILSCFKYEPNRVVMHTDIGLAPKKRSWWSPVNFLLKEGADAPMASIWMNCVHSSMNADIPIFQTWHPLIEPKPETVISDASFERPVVTMESLAAIDDLAKIQEERDRRVWFCGSYAYRGIPLLESAALSGIDVARRLGCELPFQPDQDTLRPIHAV